MLLIEVHMLEGRTDEQKEKLLTVITRAVHESIGTPLPGIWIRIQEFSPKEFMAAEEWTAHRKSWADETLSFGRG